MSVQPAIQLEHYTESCFELDSVLKIAHYFGFFVFFFQWMELNNLIVYFGMLMKFCCTERFRKMGSMNIFLLHTSECFLILLPMLKVC